MTVIEVLVASLILFMAIGLSASVFRQSSLLQLKLNNQLNVDELRSLVQPLVRFELEQGHTEGAFVLKGKTINWVAEAESNAEFVSGYNPDAPTPLQTYGRVWVYRIDIRYPEKLKPEFSFRELIWHQ